MWYSQGTVVVTNGGTNVTGTGTSFLSNARVGDGITITGSTALHEVVGVTSNTQLSIRPAYAGTTGSGRTYGISPLLGYDKDLSDSFNQLRLQFGDQLSNLQPWSTASTAQAARTALGASSSGSTVFTGTVAQGRTALGLGDAATRGVVGGTGDLMAAGAGGIWGSANYLPEDENAGSQKNGLWAIRGNNFPPDFPIEDRWSYVYLNKRSDITGSGIIQTAGNNVRFFAVRDGAISSYVTSYTTGNAMNPVGFTDGDPSGGLMEYGENANGSYVKFADGTMICTSPTVLDYGTNGWQYFSFPHEFVGAPTGAMGFTSGKGVVSARRKAVSLILPATDMGRLLFNTSGTTLSTEDGLTEDITVTTFGRWH